MLSLEAADHCAQHFSEFFRLAEQSGGIPFDDQSDTLSKNHVRLQLFQRPLRYPKELDE
jgi:hypothetical protein